jgi:hypothetical protein
VKEIANAKSRIQESNFCALNHNDVLQIASAIGARSQSGVDGRRLWLVASPLRWDLPAVVAETGIPVHRGGLPKALGCNGR